MLHAPLLAFLGLSSWMGLVAAPNPTGHWEGTMRRGASALSISVDLDTRPSRGFWSASDLGALDVPMSNLTLDGAVHWALIGDATTTTFDGTLSGDAMNGVFRESSGNGTFVLHRTARSTEKPYVVSDVAFASGDVRLAGSIFVPRSPGIHPAAVLVHGSGPEGRWATKYIADFLARHGVIALSYDKRGVGGSTGDWRTATFGALSADAKAAVHALYGRADVDRARLGVYGHSQGAEISPFIAGNNHEVHWIAAADGPVGPQYEQDLFRVNTSLRQRYSGDDLAQAERVYAEFVEAARNGTSCEPLRADLKKYASSPWLADLAIPDDSDWIWAWYRVAGNSDNTGAWSSVHVPVLILFGADDRLVPPQQTIRRTAQILQAAGNRHVWVRVFPGADHTLRIPPGSAGGWPHNAPGFLETLAAFAKTLKPDKRS